MDEAPLLTARDQRTLLLHGLAFSWEFGRLVHTLPNPAPVRCVVATNATNATFRFHQLRAGESWTASDLDAYRHELLATVDFGPRCGAPRAGLRVRPWRSPPRAYCGPVTRPRGRAARAAAPCSPRPG